MRHGSEGRRRKDGGRRTEVGGRKDRGRMSGVKRWIGLTRQGRQFVVHVKHGSTEVPAALGRGRGKGSGRFTRRILEMVP